MKYGDIYNRKYNIKTDYRVEFDGDIYRIYNLDGYLGNFANESRCLEFIFHSPSLFYINWIVDRNSTNLTIERYNGDVIIKKNQHTVWNGSYNNLLELKESIDNFIDTEKDARRIELKQRIEELTLELEKLEDN